MISHQLISLIFTLTSFASACLYAWFLSTNPYIYASQKPILKELPYAIPINFDSQDDTHTFFYILSLKGRLFCSENQCGKHFNFFLNFQAPKTGLQI